MRLLEVAGVIGVCRGTIRKYVTRGIVPNRRDEIGRPFFTQDDLQVLQAYKATMKVGRPATRRERLRREAALLRVAKEVLLGEAS